MTYTAWSADGRVIAFDGLPPAHRIYDDEIGGHSLPPRAVEHQSESSPRCSGPIIPHRDASPETRGREDMDARPHPFSGERG